MTNDSQPDTSQLLGRVADGSIAIKPGTPIAEALQALAAAHVRIGDAPSDDPVQWRELGTAHARMADAIFAFARQLEGNGPH